VVAEESTVAPLETYNVEGDVDFTKCSCVHDRYKNSKFGAEIAKEYRICTVEHLYDTSKQNQIHKNLLQKEDEFIRQKGVCQHCTAKTDVFSVVYGNTKHQLQTSYYCSLRHFFSDFHNQWPSVTEYKNARRDAQDADVIFNIVKNDIRTFTGLNKRDFNSLISKINSQTSHI